MSDLITFIIASTPYTDEWAYVLPDAERLGSADYLVNADILGSSSHLGDRENRIHSEASVMFDWGVTEQELFDQYGNSMGMFPVPTDERNQYKRFVEPCDGWCAGDTYYFLISDTGDALDTDTGTRQVVYRNISKGNFNYSAHRLVAYRAPMASVIDVMASRMMTATYIMLNQDDATTLGVDIVDRTLVIGDTDVLSKLEDWWHYSDAYLFTLPRIVGWGK